MANKGLQFEHAVMYAATSRIKEPRTREQERFFVEAAKKWDDIPKDIQDTATKLVVGMAPRLEIGIKLCSRSKASRSVVVTVT